MFNDVDETLKQYFTAELPITGGELDVAFDRPTREWSGRLARPTLNCFLYDVRERKAFRNEPPQAIPTGDGRFRRETAPLRIDLSYMLTAWTREPDDEHRILSRALAAMYRGHKLAPSHLAGALRDADVPIYGRVETADHIAKPADMWGVLDNELHASLVWVITVPLSVWVPEEGPLVRTRELRFGATGEEWRETTVQIAGVAHKKGDPATPLAGVQVTLDGTAMRATTGEDGRFAFPGVPTGERLLQYQTSDGTTGQKAITIPGPSYDIEL